MIDPTRYYLPAEAARALPRPTHASTVWRWVLRGVRGRRLASTVQGGRRLIQGADLLEFIGGERQAAQPTMTPRQAARASERAAAALDRAGW